MKLRSIATVGLVSIYALLVSGCGAKEADKERSRLELEEKARRESAAGNKAITDMNKRLFGKKSGPAPEVLEAPKSGENEAPQTSPKS